MFTISPEQKVKLAMCSLKAGLPFILYDGIFAIIVFPVNFDIKNFEDLVQDKIFLLFSPEKLEFYTNRKVVNGAKIKISSSFAAYDVLNNLNTINNNISDAGFIHSIAIKIAKKAEIIPEMIILEKKFASLDELEHFAFKNSLHKISVQEASESIEKQSVERLSSANVKLKNDTNAEFICYRSQMHEHCAIVIGEKENFKNPLVRIHSSCYTGDLLGSLACDCQDQLYSALEQIKQDEEGGVILYLLQEGRGIGLANKIKAYGLQSAGFDTVEANHALGFSDDERDFSVVKSILDDLCITKIRLITNNGRKISQLLDLGIEITQRLSMEIFKNNYNARYLKTKFEKLGHIL